MAITAADVKKLRDQTGAGMMDAKKALIEADGDFVRAAELLRITGAAKLAKRSDRDASNGIVAAAGSALIQLGAETDFVAKNDDFIAFAREVAMHIAASPQTGWISEDEVPQEAKDKEISVFEQQAADKPENIRPKIVEGMLRKWLGEVVLLNQEHVNPDKHDGKTIDQLRGDLSAKTGENVVIKRFVRFAVGE